MRALTALALLAGLLALAACGRGDAPVGKWQGAAFDGEWLIMVRLEIEPGNRIRVSAPNLQSDFAAMSPAERDRNWQGLVTTLDRQFAAAKPAAVDVSGGTIRRAGGYAPLFETDPQTGSLVFCFYSGGRLTHRVPLVQVSAFSGPPSRPPGY